MKASPLTLLSPSRRRIIQLIKRRGAVTVEEAAAALELGLTTVRQHLGRLEEAELVARSSVASGPGRPALEYRLTGAGEGLFPAQDAELLRRMIDFLIHQGYPGVVDAFFRDLWDERRAELAARLEETNAESLPERLAVVEELLDQDGFLPEITADEQHVTLRECNCPFSAAVRATRLPCRLEAQFLEHALGRRLERVEYMPDGNAACVYQFSTDEGAAPGEQRDSE